MLFDMNHFQLLDVTPLARDTLIENLRDGMLVLDSQMRVIDLNPAARSYLQLDNSVVGQPLKTARSCWPGLVEFATSHQRARTEITAGQETLRHLEVENSLLYDERGYYIGSFLTLRDISERKKAEAALHASQVAEAANHAKGMFLAMMSHEIRTPMNGVLGTVNLLLESELSPSQRELGVIAHDSAESLLRILNDILDFSKIEAGKLELAKEDFDLQALYDGLYKMFIHMAQRRHLHYTQHIGPNVPAQLRGDMGRLRQILVNLVSNAFKFTEQGEVSVRVAVEAAGDGDTAYRNGVTLRFVVSDTGIGISPDKLPTLFQAFSQVDSSYQRKYSGSGLGLVIARQLVELMGGTIGVESAEKCGTTVWFTAYLEVQTGVEQLYLTATGQPTAEPTPPHHPIALPPPAASAPLASSAPGTRVLVVEDNLTNQKVILAMLRKLGFRADIAANGLEALKSVSSNDYDLVLMDVAMPEMDGIEATRRIRAMEAGNSHHIPIIAMTAHAMSDDRTRCLSAGMDDYMTKPIHPPELAAVIRQWGQNPT